MKFIEDYLQEAEADELRDDIVKCFGRYGVNVAMKIVAVLPDRVIFQATLKRNTRISHVQGRASDVQFKLGLPVFYLWAEGGKIIIVAAKKKIEYSHLPSDLVRTDIVAKMKQMVLPYVVGYNIIGQLMVIDVSKEPHLLIGGSTNSGKTVGLKALLASIIYSKSPLQVNFILIDVGAADLMSFSRIPHLSCPVVRDRNDACQVLIALAAEMERRIDLQIADKIQFAHLSRLVLVIDEFPALFMGLDDKHMIKKMTDAVSGLLQRGRHAKIHVVVAAQNPTIQNMKIDLGNITARIAFKCAKKNFSETILGESGAENLSGQGDMLFKSSQFTELQRIQGAFISSKELERTLYNIQLKWVNISSDKKFTLNMDKIHQQIASDYIGGIPERNMSKKTAPIDKMMVQVALWALAQDSISCNMVSENFGVGWRRANNILQQLNEYGIVGELDAKLPRKVLPQSIEEVPEKVLDILQSNGISFEDISAAMSGKVK